MVSERDRVEILKYCANEKLTTGGINNNLFLTRYIWEKLSHGRKDSET